MPAKFTQKEKQAIWSIITAARVSGKTDEHLDRAWNKMELNKWWATEGP
jgi:hypothetical protein